MKYFITIFIAFAINNSILVVSSGKVLVLCPLSSQSHRNVMHGMYSGLAARGHQITVVTSGEPSEPQNNVKEVLVFEAFDYFPHISVLELRKGGILKIIMDDLSHVCDCCHRFYTHPEVQKLLTEEFDLIMHDAISNHCVYGLMHKIGAPIISISTCAATHAIVGNIGNQLPPSFVPDMSAPFGEEMNFWERTANLLIMPLTNMMFKNGVSKLEGIYRHYLGEDCPSADEIAANASLVLVNAHLSFDFSKPLLPNVIEVGGAHCRPGRKLPADLEDFVGGAKDGLILFSLGTIVRPHELPEDIRKLFVNVFAKLRQRVLWKWPLEIPDLPPNVKLLNWIPQQDVLAHPNTRLFITHGGLLSTQESIYHGVPLLYFPVFADQDSNARHAELIGIGKVLEILDVTEKQLETAIHEMLDNQKYRKKVQYLSQLFKDQPETPNERATFWAEYVLRHKGAHHLRSSARKLNIFQYYSLDSIAFILFVLCVIMWIIKAAIVKCFMVLWARLGDSTDKPIRVNQKG